MKTELWCFGKNNLDYINEGIDSYCKKINHYTPFSLLVFSLPSSKKTENPEQIKKLEYDLIAKNFKTGDYIILLDQHGSTLSSTEFARRIDALGIQSHQRIIFIIGGAFGFHDLLYEKAHLKLSFSKMTFNHLMFRLIFLEQLYRAHSILKNEPYHH